MAAKSSADTFSDQFFKPLDATAQAIDLQITEVEVLVKRYAPTPSKISQNLKSSTLTGLKKVGAGANVAGAAISATADAFETYEKELEEGEKRALALAVTDGVGVVLGTAAVGLISLGSVPILTLSAGYLATTALTGASKKVLRGLFDFVDDNTDWFFDEKLDYSAETSSVLIRGTTKRDIILTGSGADKIDGNRGADRIKSGAGADVIDGGNGKDELRGQGGRDFLIGGEKADELFGGNKRDILVADKDGAKDTLNGGAGKDMFLSGDRKDHYNGGRGHDEILLSGAKLNMIRQAKSIEKVVAVAPDGTSPRQFTVKIKGNDEGTVIDATQVNAKKITGRDGDDTILADHGINRLFGGKGDDTIRGGRDDDRIKGGDDTDTLYGNGGDDRLWAGDGVGDRLFGGKDDDTLFANGFTHARGQADDDTFVLKLSNASPLSHKLKLVGGSGEDTLKTNAAVIDLRDGTVEHGQTSVAGAVKGIENVRLLSYGSQEPAVSAIYGNGKNNVIRGNDGDNYIDGRAGQDRLFGGGGDDTYKYDPDDIIRDNQGSNTLDLRGFDPSKVDAHVLADFDTLLVDEMFVTNDVRYSGEVVIHESSALNLDVAMVDGYASVGDFEGVLAGGGTFRFKDGATFDLKVSFDSTTSTVTQGFGADHYFHTEDHWPGSSVFGYDYWEQTSDRYYAGSGSVSNTVEVKHGADRTDGDDLIEYSFRGPYDFHHTEKLSTEASLTPGYSPADWRGGPTLDHGVDTLIIRATDSVDPFDPYLFKDGLSYSVPDTLRGVDLGADDTYLTGRSGIAVSSEQEVEYTLARVNDGAPTDTVLTFA